MMKYLVLLFILLDTVQAGEHKAIFDCSSGDQYYIASRMNLIETTMNIINRDGDKAKFALTLHGECVPMVSKEYGEIVEDKDMAYVKKAQESLIRLSKKEGFEIVVCAMSLESNAISQDEVLPFVRISEDSFIDTISYQNRGYAIMTFK